MTFKAQDGQAMSTACRCSAAIVDFLSAPDTSTDRMNIGQSEELNCPAVTLVEGGIGDGGSQWKCPPGLILDTGLANSTCEDSLPMCKEGINVCVINVCIYFRIAGCSSVEEWPLKVQWIIRSILLEDTLIHFPFQSVLHKWYSKTHVTYEGWGT